MESQEILGWKGLLEVIWLLQLLRGTSRSEQAAMGFAQSSFDSMNIHCTIPLCLSQSDPPTVLAVFTPIWNCPFTADDSNPISLDLAMFPLGKTSSLNGSELLFFIKMNFSNRFQMDTLKDSTIN